MLQTDEARFQAIMATLAEVYGKKLSPQTVEIYWTALKPLAIEEVDRAAKSAIRHFEHWPKPAALFRLVREMEAAAPRPAPQLPDPGSIGLRRVNGMFLRYLLRRRSGDMFTGDVDLPARRRACIALAAWLNTAYSEDLVPQDDELQAMFDREMARIPDAGPVSPYQAVRDMLERRNGAKAGSAEVF